MKKVTYAMLIILLPLLGKSQMVNAPDTQICFNWNTMNTVWDSSAKTVYQYTNYIQGGEVLKSQQTSYNYTGGTWVPGWRTSWDWNGYLLMKDSAQNYVGGNWQNSSRTMYQYDANANEIQNQIDQWASNTWNPNQKQLKQYNSNNLIIERITQNYSGGSWNNTNKKVYGYDNNDFQNLELTLTWNGATWDSSYKVETEIQPSNILIATNSFYNANTWTPSMQSVVKVRDLNANLADWIVQSTWNSGTSSWDSLQRITYVYDANNNLLTETNYSYVSNAWEPAGKTEYLYDSNNNLTSQEYFSWDAANSIWVPASLTTYTYDASGDQTLMLLQNWDSGNNQYVNTYKCEWSYTTITSIKENGEIVLSKCRFQNPFSQGAIICNLDDNQNYLFRIFDLSGRAVTQTTMKGGSLIFNKQLPDGMYIMVIEDEKGQVVAKDKIIIQQ